MRFTNKNINFKEILKSTKINSRQNINKEEKTYWEESNYFRKINFDFLRNVQIQF